MKAKLMRWKVVTAGWTVLLVLWLGVTPEAVLSQSRDTTAAGLARDVQERVTYINRQLLEHPAPPPLGHYRIALEPGGKLTIDTRDGGMTIKRHTAYVEDIGSVHINLESREPPYTTILFVCKTGDCFLVTSENGMVGAYDRGGFDFGFDRRLARQMETAAKELIDLALADPTYGPPRQ